MKQIFLFLVALFCFSTCFSQEGVNRKKTLTAMVTEKYHTVIEKTKEERQGAYQALYNKTPIATGQYTNDKKTGIWQFYSNKGRLLEQYNYDTNTLLFEATEDTTSNIRYTVDAVIGPTDKSTKPVKIGGRYYGYLPYLKLFKLPQGVVNNINAVYTAKLELLISPGGRLADFKIHFYTPVYGEEILYPNPDLLKEEDKQFIATTLNNEPIACRIFIQCYVNYYDELDM